MGVEGGAGCGVGCAAMGSFDICNEDGWDGWEGAISGAQVYRKGTSRVLSMGCLGGGPR